MADASNADFGLFLDRLMMAESAGRSHAKNPRSSALGPFQFITSTWLAVMRKHFPEDIEDKSRRQILALRTDHDTARRAAKAFSEDNHDYLVDRGIEPTFGHLRLAFLLGASGAAEVIEAPPERSVRSILGNNVVRANPFMRRMSAADLIARATSDVDPKQQVADAKPAEPKDEAPAAQPEPEESAEVAHVGPATTVASEDAAANATPETADMADKTEGAAHVADIGPDKPAQSAPAAQSPAPRVAATQPVLDSDTDSDTDSDMESDMGTVRPGERVSVIDVKCDSRLPSCKRWIDEQVAKLMKTSGA